MMNICESAAGPASVLGKSETQKAVSDGGWSKTRCFVSDQAEGLPHKSPEPESEAERKPEDQDQRQEKGKLAIMVQSAKNNESGAPEPASKAIVQAFLDQRALAP